MDFFSYRNGRLYCEELAVADIVAREGTPAYVYSKATLVHHYTSIASAFAELKPTICYSIKSLANVNILRVLRDLGSGFDVTSGGELARALAAGGQADKIVFAGVGKTDREICEAIDAGIMAFNVESEEEFANLSRLAGQKGTRVHAALRVNPDVYDPKTHTYTVTGKKETKFGVDIERAMKFFQTLGKDKNVLLDAIHIHIGSPIYSSQPYVQAITKTLELIDRLREMGFPIEMLDIGGGFAADYEEGASPSALQYAGDIVPLLRGKGLRIVIEPGRSISCNSGVLLSEVQYVKKGGDRNFVIVDAAMTDLIRPAFYGAKHFLYPAQLEPGQEPPPRKMEYVPPGAVKVDIVGGVCESSDFLAKDRMLPPMKRGDLLAVFSAGAYGFVMSSQYNTRPRAPEILVDGSGYRVIRRRETYQDVIAPEL
ncbi:MAG: diaminopimelate decarboxylase [Planctomycetes bacterium]|jgi:diaminopimelate decarboxylase|nr:diaminopimelate decarboxylase [Planctomycetota bacterium]